MAPPTALAASVAAVGLILVGLAVWGLTMEIPSFWDPCQEWGIKGNSLSMTPTDDCPGKSGTSETKPGAALRLAAVEGVVLLAGVLAVVAAWRTQAGLALGAGLLMAGETILLFFGLSIGFALALAAAVLFLAAGARWRRRPAAK